MPASGHSRPAGSGQPGSRISIYSAQRARFELANGLCRCPPLCTPTVSANASGAVATLVSAGTGPRLRRVGVALPGALSPSRANRPDRCPGQASSVSRCRRRQNAGGLAHVFHRRLRLGNRRWLDWNSIVGVIITVKECHTTPRQTCTLRRTADEARDCTAMLTEEGEF
jgi:hypothetical protein